MKAPSAPSAPSPPPSFILCYRADKSSRAVTGDVGRMGNLRVQEIVGHKSPFRCEPERNSQFLWSDFFFFFLRFLFFNRKDKPGEVEAQRKETVNSVEEKQ